MVRALAQDGEFLGQVFVEEGEEGDGWEDDVGDEGGDDCGEGCGDSGGVLVCGGVWRGREGCEGRWERGVVHQSHSYFEDVVAEGKVGESVPEALAAVFDVLAGV